MNDATSPGRWKRNIFETIAQVAHLLRGDKALASADRKQIRNFLFLQYESPLGSVVHATPLFEALREAVPNAHVTVAASSIAASVLGNHPSIDRCIVTPNPLREFSQAVAAVRALHQSMLPGPCAIVTTVGNQRTRIALLSLLAGKATRVGHTLAPELYDTPLKFDPERGQIEANLDILRSLGHNVPFREPQMFFTQQDADHACKLLRPAEQKPEATRIAFVTQNSGGQQNRWRQDRFTQVISEMTRTSNAIPIFVGTAVDTAAIESLRLALPDPGISVAGKTTVPQLAAVLTQCDLAISLDTGTFHVARAVQLPGVVIAPAWQSALEWLPVAHARYRVLQGHRISEPSPNYAIDEITAEQVIDAALDLLQYFPPSPSQRIARVQNSLASSAALRQ